MGQGITEFRPFDKITKGEVATAISRILWGLQYDGGNPFYINHVKALETIGILTDTSNLETNELRGNVMTILMKADKTLRKVAKVCDDPYIVMACGLGDDNGCPEECKDGN